MSACAGCETPEAIAHMQPMKKQNLSYEVPKRIWFLLIS